MVFFFGSYWKWINVGLSTDLFIIRRVSCVLLARHAHPR